MMCLSFTLTSSDTIGLDEWAWDWCSMPRKSGCHHSLHNVEIYSTCHINIKQTWQIQSKPTSKQNSSSYTEWYYIKWQCNIKTKRHYVWKPLKCILKRSTCAIFHKCIAILCLDHFPYILYSQFVLFLYTFSQSISSGLNRVPFRLPKYKNSHHYFNSTMKVNGEFMRFRPFSLCHQTLLCFIEFRSFWWACTVFMRRDESLQGQHLLVQSVEGEAEVLLCILLPTLNTQHRFPTPIKHCFLTSNRHNCIHACCTHSHESTGKLVRVFMERTGHAR